MKKKVGFIRSGFCLLSVALILSLGFGVACAEYTTLDLNEQLVMGTVWYQRSAEMRALSYQAFNMARLVYDMDLEREQADLPRAVIVDIDETVLDNSPYEAGLVGKDYGYSRGWAEWIAAARAEPLPGAVEFLGYVREKGGEVFYVSNRKEKYREATLKNLRRLGFPQADDAHLLLRGATSDKTPRRRSVLKDHRVVLMMGDNLNDFDSVFANKDFGLQAAAVDLLKDRFGTRFIVLPNPMYGNWEGAVYGYDWQMSPAEKSGARKDQLIRWNLPEE